jgi:hypothetical protein
MEVNHHLVHGYNRSKSQSPATFEKLVVSYDLLDLCSFVLLHRHGKRFSFFIKIFFIIFFFCIIYIH